MSDQNNDATFRKVGQATTPLYGPRAIVWCGYASEAHDPLCKLAEFVLPGVKSIFVQQAQGSQQLSELFALPHCFGLRSPEADKPTLPRAVIMGGISERELHQLMAAYRSSGMPRPLWATLTPNSSQWQLQALLSELQAERQAIAEMQQQRAQAAQAPAAQEE